MSWSQILAEIDLFSFLGLFEFALFSVLREAEHRAARNRPEFRKLKSPRFRICHISLKSPWFQNKPFWRVLSLGAIKYIRNLKKLARTSFWCLYGRFKLSRDYLKRNHDDFFMYKIKKRRPRASWQNHQERGRPAISRRPGRSPWKEVNRQIRKLLNCLNLTD